MSIGESRDVRFVSLPIKIVRHGKCSDVPIAANGANEKPPRGGRSEIQSGDLIGTATIFSEYTARPLVPFGTGFIRLASST